MSAQYTEFLKDLIDDALIDRDIYTEDEIDNIPIEDKIEAAIPYIFTNFPIFDESYRVGLEKKILFHYYLREIGQETEDAFLLFLNRTLYEEMPFFNQLYESELIKFNPFYTQDMQKATHGGGSSDTSRFSDFKKSGSTDENSANFKSGNENSSDAKNAKDMQTGSNKRTDALETEESNAGASTGKSTSKAGMLDTPQGSIGAIGNALGEDGSGYLTNASLSENQDNGSNATARNAKDTGTQTYDNASFADRKEDSSSARKTEEADTNARNAKSEEDNKGSEVSAVKNASDYFEHVSGYTGSPASLLNDFRNTFLNIDMQVIEALSGCFMGIY